MLPHDEDLVDRIDRHIRAAGRAYKIQAYFFIFGALGFTVEKLGRVAAAEGKRHVSGQELSWGIRDYAMAQFGPSARMVLTHWGIDKTADFGRIVYDLIDMGLLGKNENDSIRDFEQVYDLDTELVENYRFKIPKTEG